MKRLLGHLKERWFISLIGALALALIVWFIGPLIAIAGVRPLDSELVRGIVVLVIILAWGLYNALTRVHAKRTDQEMVATIAKSPQKDGAADASGEVQALRQRLEEALTLLKKSAAGKSGSRYLYQLPWYMLIGPPGSGKTTALQNCGLNFPLAQRYGKEPVAGVGGTRNCDWWFTDDAVLLDTAGRYTTQDSDESADQAAWRGFLGLLKKFRPRQPINGAIVAVSIADIATLPQAERLAHARAIRQRLRELTDEFRVRFPVYLLFTKTDLVSGFVEYFDDLGREEREQVWGVTLPLDDGKETSEAAVSHFPAEFDALIERLNDRLLTRLQQDTDIGKRTQIWGFPTQAASLKEPVVEFLNEVFLPNRYESRPLLRGVYFTSGTQEGTPIDRLMSVMAGSFGLGRQRLTAFSGAGRSFFLTRLLRQVIFAEASVVSSNPAVERRHAWLRRSAYAASALGLILCAGAWTTSYFANRRLVADMNAQLATYQQQVAPYAKPVVSDDDLESIRPALATLRNLPAGYAAQSQSVPMSLTFGLYQGDKLGAAAVTAYRRALNKIFRPRLLVHLGNQIRLRINEPDFVREALKAYLMVGGDAPSIDKDFLKLAFKYDWEASFPGDQRATMRQELEQHLDALLQTDLGPLTLDQQVIDQARAAVLRSPLASQAYHIILQSDEARRLPEWRISDHAGPFVDRALIRRNGTLTSGVPGIFTYDGFHKVLLPQAAQISTTMARESWVLGQAAPRTDADTLKNQVINLYLADYSAQWDRLLGEVTVAPFHGMREAADVLNALARPDSPLKLFYASASAETTLTRPEGTAASATEGAAQKAAGAATAGAPAALKKLLGGALAAGPAPGQSVDDHFKWLHDYVGPGGAAPAPIDDTLRSLNDAYLQINGLAQAGSAPAKPTGGGALDALKTGASRAPPRIGEILTQIQTNASNLTSGSLRDQIRGDWTAKVLPFCKQALDNRYPMVRGAAADVTLDDFSRLFKPNGLIDAFFSSELQTFVVTTTTPWQWQKVGDTALGFSADALAQFRRAAAIRDGFFGAGAAAPSFRLELTPVSLDPKSTQVLIDIDGQQTTYAHEPPRPFALQWPGPSGTHEARLVFAPPDPSDPLSQTFSGPWSLFRLFDAGQVERGDLTDRERITFSLGTRKAVYDVRASSVINPLAMKELGEFRCPTL